MLLNSFNQEGSESLSMRSSGNVLDKDGGRGRRFGEGFIIDTLSFGGQWAFRVTASGGLKYRPGSPRVGETGRSRSGT